MKARATTLSMVLAVLAAIAPQAYCQYPGSPPPGYPSGGPAVAGYSYADSLMQPGYEDSAYYQQEGAPQMLPEGAAPGSGEYYEDFGGINGGYGNPYGVPNAADFDVRRHRFWFNADMLMWTRHKRNLPPLVTSSPPLTPRNGGPLPPIAGVFGNPSTTVLFGGKPQGHDIRLGGATDFGMWLDPPNEIGIGGGFWAVGNDDTNYTASSTGSLAILGVPFYNTAINMEDALLLGYPNATFPPTQAGTVNVYTSNEIYGGDAYFRLNMIHWFGTPRIPGFAGQQRPSPFYNFDMLLGYQMTRVDDLLNLHGDFVASTPASVSFTDYFRTKNKFNGGMLGMAATVRKGRWSLKGTGKVGFGNMRQQVLIAGTNSFDVGGGPIVTPGGLFAQTSNIGNHVRDHFAYVPQVNLTLGYQVTRVFRLTMGYQFIYWSSVVMAGDQVDRSVNPALFGGNTGPIGTHPTFSYHATDFWAMGGNFGLNAEF